jgi:adhesin transport system outer membrane protein
MVPMFKKIAPMRACWVLAFGVAHAVAWASEPQATLSVDAMVAQAVQTHPQIQAAKFQIEARKKDLDANRRMRWPDLSLVYESDENKNLGAAASRLVRVEQSLWDYGRVGALIGEADVQVQLAHVQLEIQKQDLGLQVVHAWQQLYTAHFKQQHAQWAERQMARLESQMRSRVQAGASPTIDLELVNSRLLQAQVDRAGMQAQRAIALGQLRLLTGLPALQSFSGEMEALPSPQRLAYWVATVQQLPVAEMAAEHNAVRRAHLAHQAMNRQLKAKSAERLGQLYLRADFPLEKTQANDTTDPTWFVGLRFTPGAGFTSWSQTQALAMRLESAMQDVAAARLDIERQIQTDQQEFLSAHSRVEALQRSATGAQRVLDSYQAQFVAGRKSWLDLLNAVREHAQTQFQRVEAEAALVGAWERLRMRSPETMVLKAKPA